MLIGDDWYNRFAVETESDDFRFLYLGEDGSFTQLHHDVCMSHSWSTSLCGTTTSRLQWGGLSYVGIKEWTLIAPEDAHYLKNPMTDALPSTLDSQHEQFPFLKNAREKAIVVRQYPGETIFVPSGWYHQVQNHGSSPSPDPLNPSAG